MSECKSGKKRYQSQTIAQIAVIRRQRVAGRGLRIYRCPLCRGYHLTKQPRKTVERSVEQS